MENLATEVGPGLTSPSARTFDGIICLGGADWWYHNRGHYDMQMMRFLRRKLPILYVNSIGTRVPSIREGGMFFRRLSRKLGSWRRGFHRLDESFALLSPVAIPGRLGMALSGPLLARQVRSAAARLGIRNPLLWVECLPGAELLARLPVAGVVYQRTDRYEEFPGTDRARMESYDRQLKEAADVTLYCSKLLYEQESTHCSSAVYIDHGVDFEDFEAAGKNPQDPEDVHPIVRPRVGFVGGIDEHTFDRRLFLQVAERLADVQFVLVGACSLGEDWCTLPNVTLLGRKPYPEVPAYMAACDVLIMPWNDNDWIRACNPVKLKEYLAVGRPIVSTDFPELRRYEGYIRVARSAEEFATQIGNALAAPDDPEHLRARVRGESWSARADAVISRLADAGLEVREQRGSPESNERRY